MFLKEFKYNKLEFDSGSDECLEFVLYSAS